MLRMLRTLWRRQQPFPVAHIGVRNAEDAHYRHVVINEHIVRMADKSATAVADLVCFLDTWVILEAETNGTPCFIPSPGWDLEALMTRDSYPDEEQAAAAVAAFGGVLRVTRSRN